MHLTDVRYVRVGRKMLVFLKDGGQFLGNATLREALGAVREERRNLKNIRVNIAEVHSQQEGLPV